MSNDDICGAECNDGSECQHPAGSCPVATHNGGGENSQGRPSKFTDGRARDAIDAAREGKSKAGCARAAGVDKATVSRWLNKNPDYDGGEFRNAFRRARADGESEWIREGRGDDGDASFAKFMLSTSYDYVKTEKREVDASHEHTGEDGGPVEIAVNETVVETGYDE